MRQNLITVRLVPAVERGWTDVEVQRGERVCVMAHVLSKHAFRFVEASVAALESDLSPTYVPCQSQVPVATAYG